MLRSYVRLIVFAVALLAGIQAPGLVDQYVKRVQAHQLEATQNFAGFQNIADRYYGGDVAALIAHHLQSSDAPFHEEGKTIEKNFARLTLLTRELKDLQGSLIARMAHVAFNPNREMLDETAKAYSYTVPLDPAAILCGVCIAVLAALFVELILLGLMALLPRPEALRPGSGPLRKGKPAR
jgi:Protein of unknown function (DUF2937)